MKGEKTPCMPSLVPVVQLAHPGKLLGRMVDRSGALEPSRIRRERIGNRPACASGLMMSNVAPSSPMITVFIGIAAQPRLNMDRPSMLSGTARPIESSNVGAISVI